MESHSVRKKWEERRSPRRNSRPCVVSISDRVTLQSFLPEPFVIFLSGWSCSTRCHDSSWDISFFSSSAPICDRLVITSRAFHKARIIVSSGCAHLMTSKNRLPQRRTRQCRWAVWEKWIFHASLYPWEMLLLPYHRSRDSVSLAFKAMFHGGGQNGHWSVFSASSFSNEFLTDWIIRFSWRLSCHSAVTMIYILIVYSDILIIYIS